MSLRNLSKATAITLIAITTITVLLITGAFTESDGQNETSGQCGEDATWTYSDGNLIISGTGEMYDYYVNTPPWDGYRNEIKSVIIGEGITYIGGKSLEGLTNMTSISISSTVESTGAYILRYCNSLTSLTIPGNVKSIGEDAVYECNKLKNLTLEVGITNIWNSFWKLPALEEVTIPEGIEDMGYEEFSNCGSLKKVNLPSTLKVVRGFNRCDSLESIIIPDNVHTMFTSFFACKKLEQVELGKSVRTIYANALFDCPLKYISFPSSLRDIYPMTTVQFYNSDGSVQYNCNWTELAGKTFKGIDGRNLYEWVGQKVTAKYDENGGSQSIPEQEYSAFEKITLPRYTGNKEGYNFIGWDDGSAVLGAGSPYQFTVKNVVFKATWEPVETCTIVFDVDGGSKDMKDVTKEMWTQYTLPDYKGTKAGYSFDGWYYEDTKYQPGSKILLDAKIIELKAIWSSAPMHHVTYDPNGGKGPEPVQQDVAEGQSFEAAKYNGYKTGYRFEGWSYEGRTYLPGDSVVMGSQDIVMIAIWSSTPMHHVTYDPNGGKGSEPVQQHVFEGDKFEILNYFGSKDGYDFKGWLYGGTIHQPGEIMIMPPNDIVLIAQWLEKPAPTPEQEDNTIVVIGIIGAIALSLVVVIILLRTKHRSIH